MKSRGHSNTVTRRDAIKGSVAVAAMAFAKCPLSMFGGPVAEEGGRLIPFLDMQPAGKKQTNWSQLKNWYTKSEDLYVVSHYPMPTLQAENHSLEISGLVKKPRTLALD